MEKELFKSIQKNQISEHFSMWKFLTKSLVSTFPTSNMYSKGKENINKLNTLVYQRPTSGWNQTVQVCVGNQESYTHLFFESLHPNVEKPYVVGTFSTSKISQFLINVFKNCFFPLFFFPSTTLPQRKILNFLKFQL